MVNVEKRKIAIITANLVVDVLQEVNLSNTKYLETEFEAHGVAYMVRC